MTTDCQLCGADFVLATGDEGSAIELTDGSTLVVCADCAAVVQPLVDRAERREPKPADVRVYTCTDHETHSSVGGASVVLAHDEAEARTLLGAELRAHKLITGKRFTLTECPRTPAAYVLCDGSD